VPRRGLDAPTVIAAAVKIADSEGLAAVTVARVASELGVRGPSIYNHVPGREGLVRGIALDGLRDLTQRLRLVAIGTSGTTAIANVADAYRGFARQRPGSYDAIQRGPQQGDAEQLQAAQELVDTLAGVLRAWDLDETDEIHAIRVMRSALHGFVDLERLGGFQLDVDPDDTFTRVITNFAAGLGPRRT
jgi:AcrR family transcriptional regulator